MAQLTKGMYGGMISPPGLFGLYNGQIRTREAGKLTHNSGWFNGRGERLGWGDLSAEDMRRIASELEPGETFVVISESDDLETAGGVDDVAAMASYVVAAGNVYWSEWDDHHKTDTVQKDRLEVLVIAPEDVKVLMTTGRQP